MDELLKLILKLSISGSVFFLIFCSLSYFTKKIFSAKWHLFILKINIIFYLIPIILIYDIIPKKSRDISVNSFNIVFRPIESSSYFIGSIRYLAIIWAIGVVSLTVWSLYCYKRFARSIEKSSYSDKALEDIIYKCKSDLDINTTVYVKRSYLVSCPMIVGIIKPTIIFPASMEYSPKLIPVVMHELIHYKRMDLLFKLFQLVISIVHWFNPIVYIMNNSFEKWCEISCDEIVAENMSYTDRKEYGNTILSIIERVNEAPNFLCFYLCSDKKYIKRRLGMMLNMKKENKFKKVFGGVLVCAITLASVGISVVATPNGGTENIKIEANDENIKSLLEEQMDELKSTINAGKDTRGSVVAINTETGEVLGIASYHRE